jgi:hypothetical protein
MKRLGFFLAVAILAAMTPLLIPAQPASPENSGSPAPLSKEALAACDELSLDPDRIAALEAKPLYEFSEQDVDAYLGFVQAIEPDLPKRVVRLGRKNINQPYEIFLLGEFPFELYDPQPLYCLTKSDCVVFSEHTYAMALSHDWPSFMAMLQRIRYRNGVIGAVTRNHFTVADWDRNNAWLARDITNELAGDKAHPFLQTCDRAAFYKKKYDIDSDVAPERIEISYISYEDIPDIQGKLQNGDFVNVIFGSGEHYAGHTGLIAIGDDGTVNFLHSTPPKVREQPLMEYVESKVASNPKRLEKKQAPFVGFKFLRLEKDPIANLRAIDGPNAPRVTIGNSKSPTP